MIQSSDILADILALETVCDFKISQDLRNMTSLKTKTSLSGVALHTGQHGGIILRHHVSMFQIKLHYCHVILGLSQLENHV